MDRAALRRLARDLVARLEAAQVVPEPDTAPEDDRSNGGVQLVNEAGLEEVARDADSTADPNILPTGSVTIDITCVVPQARMNNPNRRNIQSKTRSRRRRTSRNSATGIAA